MRELDRIQLPARRKRLGCKMLCIQTADVLLVLPRSRLIPSMNLPTLLTRCTSAMRHRSLMYCVETSVVGFCMKAAGAYCCLHRRRSGGEYVLARDP